MITKDLSKQLHNFINFATSQMLMPIVVDKSFRILVKFFLDFTIDQKLEDI